MVLFIINQKIFTFPPKFLKVIGKKMLFHEKIVKKLLDKLLKALLISLGAFVFGAISLISSLGAIPTNPLGALTGAILLGGGLIGGSTVFLGLRKNHVKKEFSHEIMALKGEFRGLIKSKIEGDLLDNFLMPILEEWKEKDQEISQKIQSLSQIQERVIQLQRELKSLEQGEE
ncbi:MAG: hypothetical protein D6785_13345 [Planctomycetota bacterium]|nr:MAG: hypothetical protein D6785_13345 [Planctomycetota bacterium]